MNLAILGATSHIAKGIIYRYLSRDDDRLYLYTRSPGKLRQFLVSNGLSESGKYRICEGYEGFPAVVYDGIINCVGAGTYKHHPGDFTVYFTLTEQYDNLVIEYLRNVCPEAIYISMSSGAVYGRDHLHPVDEQSVNVVRVNRVLPEDYYAIARLNAEAKHRAFSHLNIADIRIFSYFSRYMDITENYFMAELINSLIQKRVFQADDVDMVRDYLHPADLFSMINSCLNSGRINDAFDMSSSRPVRKTEILEYFSNNYGLKYEMISRLRCPNATGSKAVYCSTYRNDRLVAHRPQFSSMDTIRDESAPILGPGRAMQSTSREK